VAPGQRLPLELTAALALAFVFSVLYIVSGQVLFGQVATLTEAADYQRVAGALSLLSLTAAVMPEDSAGELFKRLRASFFGGRGDGRPRVGPGDAPPAAG
jgi:hypothetical protein